jgi:hypothetical protein
MAIYAVQIFWRVFGPIPPKRCLSLCLAAALAITKIPSDKQEAGLKGYRKGISSTSWLVLHHPWSRIPVELSSCRA